MICFPNAKINIGLFITGKRPDGYHDIESIFYPVSFYDILEINQSDDAATPLIQVFGHHIEGKTEDNLVVKSIGIIDRFLTDSGQVEKRKMLHSWRFYLQKEIPTGAGLGGGSSDGTFTLLKLAELLGLKTDVYILEKWALQLGSDCPFFVRNNPALIKGRGEIIHPVSLNLKGLNLLLIHPGIHISTASAYSQIQPAPVNMDWDQVFHSGPEKWSQYLRNDFEKTVFMSFPEIKKVKDKIIGSGAVYAQMSGSGSAVYGIFKPEIDLHPIKEKFKQENYRVFSCEL